MRNLNLKNGAHNHLPKSYHGCKLRCVWLYVLLQKKFRVEFFIGSLLQMLKANNFDGDGCRKNIHCIGPSPKDENFIFCLLQSFKKKKSFQRDIKVGNIVLVSLPRQSLDDPETFPQTTFLTSFNPCIDHISYLLQSLDKQTIFVLQLLYFSSRILLALNSAQNIFLTRLDPCTENLSYLLQSEDRQFQVPLYLFIFQFLSQ